jgi:hypothetical protein
MPKNLALVKRSGNRIPIHGRQLQSDNVNSSINEAVNLLEKDKQFGWVPSIYTLFKVCNKTPCKF